MSQALADGTDLAPQPDYEWTLEQRIFAWSPLGTGATALAIFIFLAALYAVAASLAGWPLLSSSGHGLSLPQESRGALVLSLLIATALGMQRYARIKDLEEAKNVTGTLAKCFNRNYFGDTPDFTRRLGVATVIGAVFGLTLNVFFSRKSAGHDWMFTAPRIWFALASMILSMMFARGLVMTRMGGEATSRFIQNDLVIDLLRIDELSPLGRSSARVSLIWFSVSAVSLLSLGSDMGLGASIALTAVSAGLGIAIFVLTMEKVHRRIKAAKTSELERLRSQMDALRHELHTNAESALKLQGLIAYEQRIERAPEWPFDQTTAMRLGASALILTVPWFGQALAASLVDRIGQIVH
jgi:hypothetical protein